jgi:hypothetical protein
MAPEAGRRRPKDQNLIADKVWLKRIDDWRKRQDGPISTRSDAIRKLVEMSLDADSTDDKPKPKKSADKNPKADPLACTAALKNTRQFPASSRESPRDHPPIASAC